MRQRNVKNQEEILATSSNYFKAPGQLNQEIIEKIKDADKVCIEIGMGKGQYIFNKAYQNPYNIYFGIELNAGVLCLAIKKMQREQLEKMINVSNLYVTDIPANKLEELFLNQHFDEIYLNFSDPWPKKRHEKRRLTYKTQIELYKKLLKKDGRLYLKTDNRKFFEYSIKSMLECKMHIEEISLDVYEDIQKLEEWLKDNIPTEYEEKFREKGKIYAVKFSIMEE